MIGRRLAWGFLLIAGLVGMVFVPSCSKAPDPWAGLDDGRKRVVVSFPPLYSFVKAVGGDHVAIICLCINEEPHEFEPDVQRSLVFRKADLVFSNGLGVDRFTEKLIEHGDNKKILHVKLGEKLPANLLIADEEHKDQAVKEYDPHVWLGTAQAILMVKTIRDELCALDPAHKDDYTRNAMAYVEKLEALRAGGMKGLLAKRSKDNNEPKLLSSHEFLDYFERTFGLEVTPIVDTPEDKPAAERLAVLVKKMREERISVIAIEPGGAKARTEADSLKAEIKDPVLRDKVKIIVFDPLETANEAELKAEGGDWYLKRMRQNLDALIEALP